MPVRIYSLAKELKLDSKELVDICAKAGITGKGSALASLTDEEVARVKEHLQGGSPSAKPSKASGNIPPAIARKSAGRKKEPGVLKREDSVVPTGAAGRPQVLEGSIKKPVGVHSSDANEQEKRRPIEAKTPAVPRLAPMPAANQPVPPKASNEPAPQKPEIRLPKDAIKHSKAGTKPLSSLIRKHEKKTSSAKKSPDRPGHSAGPAAPGRDVASVRGGRKAKVKKEFVNENTSVLGGRQARQNRRKQGTRGRGGDDRQFRRRRSRSKSRSNVKTVPRKGKIVIQLPCTVRDFSEASGIAVPSLLGWLLQLGTMVNITSQLEIEQVEFAADEFELDLDIRDEVTFENQLQSLDDTVDPEGSLQPRPPIITFLGHVDHGKTSLLDKIIGIDVVSGESGGITQHIRAYQIKRDGRKISFVDTPGHEAFTEMRARGTNVTDIAVLVVAADDGVMPQTEEAISHARAAGVPIVVALNKMDLPGVNIDRVYQELATNELIPIDWSPDGVEVIKTSAISGEGIDDLLETLLLTADLHEYQVNPDRPAIGTCLESHQEQGRGVVAKLIVQRGTLKVGDVIVCGPSSGRVQAMFDTLHTDEVIDAAGPSTPVNVTGLDRVPEAGDKFYVVDDITMARDFAGQCDDQARQSSLSGTIQHVTLETLFDRLGERREVQTLNLIIRADVRGSIEAIRKELEKLKHDEVQIKILQSLVGGVTEADVHLAHASDAIIVGFNVVADEGARMLADKFSVDVRRYDIIYKLTEDIKLSVEGRLKPAEQQVELGRALIQATFSISKIGTIAGCRVISGKIERNSRVRVIRDSRIIGEYPLDSLRREKNDVKEAREGMECGMRLSGFNDMKEGDVLEAYKIEEVARTLSS